ncbi:MAG: hypothetical protein QXD66_03925 [Candidatus Nezhaarchaeales archaeon]|nr:MAG: hypothetical protein DSO06_02660 [Candidatus Nezhaarchaeota archaeon WYZ-LMO8]TDA35643.1 MAG: hypothetical protein DSO05_05045 [Candidatus Nezhaarchaeota archaeon WYZ-LMO7]
MVENEVRKRIIAAMIKALAIGLIVPLFTISLTVLALFLFKTLHVFVRALLMTLFGLAGFGAGTIITLRLLERIRLDLRPRANEVKD